MKNILVQKIMVLMTASGLLIPSMVNAQVKSKCLDRYLEKLPQDLALQEKVPQKYIMTAEYFNKDIYGELQNKVKVSGEYTRGLGNGYVRWNDVSITRTGSHPETYLEGVKQEYMENIKYVPSSETLEESFFRDFSDHPDNIFARNLIWDMMAIEGFSWQYFDSLHLNKMYIIPDLKGDFQMAEIGKYNHQNVQLCWTGISVINNQTCAVIEYRALNNKLEVDTDVVKSKGSELYWGKNWVSLENKQIMYAEMYSYTIQELDIKGFPDKSLLGTIRVLHVDKIQ